MLLNLKSAMLIYCVSYDDAITLCYYKTNNYVITYIYYTVKSSIESALLTSAHMQLISNI